MHNHPLDIIETWDNPIRDIGLYLHNVLSEHFGLRPQINFKLPFYYKKTWICYLSPQKNKSLALCFIRGNELSNSQGLLNAKGRKLVSSIDLKFIDDPLMEQIHEIITEAIILDERVPLSYKSSKSKK